MVDWCLFFKRWPSLLQVIVSGKSPLITEHVRLALSPTFSTLCEAIGFNLGGTEKYRNKSTRYVVNTVIRGLPNTRALQDT